MTIDPGQHAFFCRGCAALLYVYEPAKGSLIVQSDYLGIVGTDDWMRCLSCGKRHTWERLRRFMQRARENP